MALSSDNHPGVQGGDRRALSFPRRNICHMVRDFDLTETAIREKTGRHFLQRPVW